MSRNGAISTATVPMRITGLSVWESNVYVWVQFLTGVCDDG